MILYAEPRSFGEEESGIRHKAQRRLSSGSLSFSNCILLIFDIKESEYAAKGYLLLKSWRKYPFAGQCYRFHKNKKVMGVYIYSLYATLDSQRQCWHNFVELVREWLIECKYWCFIGRRLKLDNNKERFKIRWPFDQICILTGPGSYCTIRLTNYETLRWKDNQIMLVDPSEGYSSGMKKVRTPYLHSTVQYNSVVSRIRKGVLLPITFNPERIERCEIESRLLLLTKQLGITYLFITNATVRIDKE